MDFFESLDLERDLLFSFLSLDFDLLDSRDLDRDLLLFFLDSLDLDLLRLLSRDLDLLRSLFSLDFDLFLSLDLDRLRFLDLDLFRSRDLDLRRLSFDRDLLLEVDCLSCDADLRRFLRDDELAIEAAGLGERSDLSERSVTCESCRFAFEGGGRSSGELFLRDSLLDFFGGDGDRESSLSRLRFFSFRLLERESSSSLASPPDLSGLDLALVSFATPFLASATSFFPSIHFRSRSW